MKDNKNVFFYLNTRKNTYSSNTRKKMERDLIEQLKKEVFALNNFRFTSASEFEELIKNNQCQDYICIEKTYGFTMVPTSQLDEYKENGKFFKDYILVYSIEEKTLELYFDGEKVTIDNMEKLLDNLNLSPDFPSVSLTARQVYQTITLNGGHSPNDSVDLYFDGEKIKIDDSEKFKRQLFKTTSKNLVFTENDTENFITDNGGHTPPKSTPEERLDFLRKLALSGDKKAAYFLGRLYSEKKIETISYSENENKLFENSYSLLKGQIFQNIREIDYKKAVKFMELGVQNGNYRCALWLANLYKDSIPNESSDSDNESNTDNKYSIAPETAAVKAIQYYKTAALLREAKELTGANIPYIKLTDLFSDPPKGQENKIHCTIIDALEEIAKSEDDWRRDEALDTLLKLSKEKFSLTIKEKIENTLEKFPSKDEREAKDFFKYLEKEDISKWNLENYIKHYISYFSIVPHMAINGLKYLFLAPPESIPEAKGNIQILNELITRASSNTGYMSKDWKNTLKDLLRELDEKHLSNESRLQLDSFWKKEEKSKKNHESDDERSFSYRF